MILKSTILLKDISNSIVIECDAFFVQKMILRSTIMLKDFSNSLLSKVMLLSYKMILRSTILLKYISNSIVVEGNAFVLHK